MGRKRKPENEKAVTKTELLTAIHKYCMQCSGNIRAEVEHCRIESCELYHYRNPKACNMTAGSESIGEEGQYEQIDIYDVAVSTGLADDNGEETKAV